MFGCGTESVTEPTWEAHLARHGFKRADHFYHDDTDVIDAEYTRVTDNDAHRGGGNGHQGGGQSGDTVDAKDRGLVIRGPWEPPRDEDTPDVDATWESPDEPPPGWICADDGVYCRTDKGPVKVCGPLKVMRFVKTHGQYAREVKLRTFQGEDKTLQIPEGDLHASGKGLVKFLANQGLEINQKADHLVRQYLHDWRPVTVAHGVETPGWQDGLGKDLIYVLPDKTVIMPGQLKTTMTLVPNFPLREGAKAHGTLDAWRENVASPACRLNAGILALSSGFAPVLVKLAPEGINFLINFYGKSGVGKSTMLKLAASIWGPHWEEMKTWNGTEKGLIDLAGTHRDRAMFLDELGAREHDPRAMSKMIYSLAGGQGRVRAKAMGGVSGGEVFRTLVISSGEHALHANLNSDRTPPNRGTVHRGIDIEIHDAAAELPQAEREPAMNQLREATDRVYGQAGRAFLTTLVEQFKDADDLKAYLSEQVAEVVKEFGVPRDDAAITRGLWRFALVVVAGELAVQYGLMPLTDPREVRLAILPFAKAWYERVSLQANQQRYLTRIKDFILKSERRFQLVNGPIPANRAGWIVFVGPGATREKCFAFTEEALLEAAQERDKRAVIKALVEAELLFRNNSGRPKAKITPVDERLDAYVVRAAILGHNANQD